MREQTNERTYTTTKHITTLLLHSRVKKNSDNCVTQVWMISAWNHYSTEIIGINHSFVFHTVKWYNKMDYIVDSLKEAHPCSVHLPNVIHTIHEWVKWNLLCKQKQLAVEMSVSTWRISLTLHDNLKLHKYGCCVSYTVTPSLRKMYHTRCAALLQWFKEKKYRNIFFTDEIFSIQEKLN